MEWTKKYSPRNEDEIIGNFSIRMEIIKPFFEGWKKGIIFKKGLVFFGIEGNGKHTIIDIYSKKYNYDIINYEENKDLGTTFLSGKHLVVVEKEKFTKKELKNFELSRNPIIFIFEKFWKIPKDLNQNLFLRIEISKPYPNEIKKKLLQICSCENIEIRNIDENVKLNNVRSCIQTLQKCALGGDIEIEEKKDSISDIIGKLLTGKLDEIDIPIKILGNWLIANNINISEMLKWEYMTRTYGTTNNLWKDIALSYRKRGKIKFPTKKKKNVKEKVVKPKTVVKTGLNQF